MFRPALGDVALTWTAQVAVAAVPVRWLWTFGPWHLRQAAAMAATAVALSIGVELWALRTGRWEYAELAPLVPGPRVSLIPGLQFIVPLPLSFALTRRLLVKTTSDGKRIREGPREAPSDVVRRPPPRSMRSPA